MSIVENKCTLDLQDIQGMVTRGYSHLKHTAYLMLSLNNAERAKTWLANILPLVDSADHTQKKARTAHLAFGAAGLKALGLSASNLASFPFPFREGISTQNRNRVLGDYGENAPENWRWGATNNEHILLILHAKTAGDLAVFVEEQKTIAQNSGGLDLSYQTYGYLRDDNKEPFGFHDGISQPVIKGSGKPGPENDLIEAGEFLLGHKNEHGQYPTSPVIEDEQGTISLLPTAADGSGKKDLGKNGTFLVFRQMEQHVDAFWEFMEQRTKNADGSVNELEKIKLASKCIGRWPSGASLVNYPDSDPGGDLKNDDFGYADDDPNGLKCPFGSHLRRNNPRDAHRNYSKKQSLKITRRHRILRRGRNYELPSSDAAQKTEVGLQFLCFNANIELQFEFIQHEWSNNNQMTHLSNDVDVLIGVPAEGNPTNKERKFTLQSSPVNEFINVNERFVTIKGGGYFFFPSITALRYLSTI